MLSSMSEAKTEKPVVDPAGQPPAKPPVPPKPAPEVGGPQGPEPTRYGDWERAGRCVDF